MALLYISYLLLAIFVVAAAMLLLAGITDCLARRANLTTLQPCARWLHSGARAFTFLLTICVLGSSVILFASFLGLGR